MDRAQEIAAELMLDHTAEESIRRAIAAEREACAKIVDDNVEGSSGGDKVLMPRGEGNLSGTAYATAIRARST
jgi:hypothetical protein